MKVRYRKRKHLQGQEKAQQAHFSNWRSADGVADFSVSTDVCGDQFAVAPKLNRDRAPPISPAESYESFQTDLS